MFHSIIIYYLTLYVSWVIFFLNYEYFQCDLSIFFNFSEGNLVGASELLGYNTPGAGGGMANSYHGAAAAGFASYPTPFGYDAPIEHSAISTGNTNGRWSYT